MTNEVDQKTIDKIRKMLRLSKSANENEAANALTKAQMFLAMRNLTLEAVQETTAEEYYDYVTEATGQSHWRRTLLHVIAKYNFCYTVYIQGTRKMAIIGSKTNQQAVIAMYKTIQEQLTRIGRRERLYHGQGDPKRWLNGFYEGAVDTINLRLKEAQERMLTVRQPTPAPEPHSEDVFIPRPTPEYDDQPQEDTAQPEPAQVLSLLVLTDEKLEKSAKKHFEKLSFPKRTRKLLLSAYERGIQGGYEISLSAGLLEEAK